MSERQDIEQRAAVRQWSVVPKYLRKAVMSDLRAMRKGLWKGDKYAWTAALALLRTAAAPRK